MGGGYHAEAAAATRMLATLAAKFAFLAQEPYTLLRAHDRQVAAAVIEARDGMVSRGERPHRVTERSVDTHTDSLRDDMKAYAEGGEASAVLLRELLSYQLAKVDDMWAESAHRDATNVGKRANGSKVPFVGASMRRRQTMDSLASMTAVEQACFF